MLRFLIVFIFSTLSVCSQNTDTLLSHVLKIENDTQRVNQLFKYGYGLIDKNPQLAFEFAKNCEKAAQKSGSLMHISKSYDLSGILLCRQGNYKKALACFEKYMSVNKKLNNILLLGYGCTNLGNVYLRTKEFQKAESCFLSAVEYYNSAHNESEVANGLINLGALNQQQKQLDAAKENYEKALQAGKELNDYEIKAICLNNLAQIFSDKGNYEKALAYNYDALELRELMGLDVDKIDSYLSIAEIALKQKNTVLAQENLDFALALSTKLDYYEGKMIWHKLMAELYSQKNNYQLAFENLKIYQQLNDSFMVIQNEETYEFKETEQPNYNCIKPAIKNVWLLSLLSLILIIIPFVLIRYKR